MDYVHQDIAELIARHMDYTTLKKYSMVSTSCRDAGRVQMQKLMELERKLLMKMWNNMEMMRRGSENRYQKYFADTFWYLGEMINNLANKYKVI